VCTYVYTHKCTHTKIEARYGGLQCISKAKPTLLLTNTVSSEVSSEIPVILMKCILMHVAYSDSEESFYFANRQQKFAMSFL